MRENAWQEDFELLSSDDLKVSFTVSSRIRLRPGTVKEIVEGWGGEFSLLFIPDAGRFGSLLPTGFAYDQLRDQVVDAAAGANVNLIDLVPIFEGETNPRRFYAADGHFSEEGADFVADLLLEAVKN
jgi:hypothetical protein